MRVAALGIMGATVLVAPVPVPAEILGFDLWVMLGVAVVLGVPEGTVKSRLHYARNRLKQTLERNES